MPGVNEDDGCGTKPEPLQVRNCSLLKVFRRLCAHPQSDFAIRVGHTTPCAVRQICTFIPIASCVIQR